MRKVLKKSISLMLLFVMALSMLALAEDEYLNNEKGTPVIEIELNEISQEEALNDFSASLEPAAGTVIYADEVVTDKTEGPAQIGGNAIINEVTDVNGGKGEISFTNDGQTQNLDADDKSFTYIGSGIITESPYDEDTTKAAIPADYYVLGSEAEFKLTEDEQKLEQGVTDCVIEGYAHADEGNVFTGESKQIVDQLPEFENKTDTKARLKEMAAAGEVYIQVSEAKIGTVDELNDTQVTASAEKTQVNLNNVDKYENETSVTINITKNVFTKLDVTNLIDQAAKAVIVNITDLNDDETVNYQVDNGSTEGHKESKGNVFFNFGSFNGTVSINATADLWGNVIAPLAKIVNSGKINGSVVADTYMAESMSSVLSGAESGMRRVDGSRVTPKPTPVPVVIPTPNINGSNTHPTPTPMRTEKTTPTPVPTPVATPDNTTEVIENTSSQTSNTQNHVVDAPELTDDGANNQAVALDTTLVIDDNPVPMGAGFPNMAYKTKVVNDYILYNEFSDMGYARIEIPDVLLSCPIMLGEEFADKDSFGNESAAGSLYVPYACDFLNDNAVTVYGNNVTNGTMFSCLPNMTIGRQIFVTFNTVKLEYSVADIVVIPQDGAFDASLGRDNALYLVTALEDGGHVVVIAEKTSK